MNHGAGAWDRRARVSVEDGYADYLLFIDRRAIGANEAKPEGMTLTGVEAQVEKYSAGALAQCVVSAVR